MEFIIRFRFLLMVLFSLNFYGVSSKNNDVEADVCIFRIQEDYSGICAKIGDGPAPDLEAARKLWIDFSDYRLIAADTLSNLTHLREIVVESGDLVNLEEGALCAPPNLTSLQLNLNLNINPVSRHLLKGCHNLERIKVASSRIIAEDDVFADFKDSLKVARFEKIIDPSFANLTREIFEASSSLETLKVSQCHVTTLDRDFFANSSNLKEINLSSNQLRTIENGTFNHLDRLQRLDLSQNDLLDFPIELIDGLESLQILDLGLNHKIRNLNASAILERFRQQHPKLNTFTVNSLAFGDERDFSEIQREFLEQGINLIETRISDKNRVTTN